MEGWTKTLVVFVEPELPPERISELTKDDIDEIHVTLARCYQRPTSDLDYRFKKIVDIEDEDQDNHIRLIFFLKEDEDREIFNIKMPIPSELIQMALQIAKPKK